MNLLVRFFKFLQAEAHALVSKWEDPVKLMEQSLRDLKGDFDEAMRSVAQVKAIAISARKELETKKQLAADYEQKAILLLQKGKHGELEESEADRLAEAALNKREEALREVERLTNDVKKYGASLEQMSKKILELKNTIKTSENEYRTLKARAVVAKTTKRINRQLASVGADSALALMEEMRQKISAEENLAEAYGEASPAAISLDEEIDQAIGMESDVRKSLEEMKRRLPENPAPPAGGSDIERLKRELDS